MRGTILEVHIIRAIMYWGLIWGPVFKGNCHIYIYIYICERMLTYLF